MGRNEIIDAWIQYSMGWFEALGREISFCPSTQHLVDKLEELSSDPSKAAEGWSCIDRIVELNERYDNKRLYPKECSLARVHCGIAAYRMGNLLKANGLLRDAISNCTDKHDRAVIFWLRGCIFWLSRNPGEATIHWEKSLCEFEDQKTMLLGNSYQVSWYSNKIKELREAIAKAIEEDFPHAPFDTEAGPAPVISPAETPAGQKKAPSAWEQVIQAYFVYDEIPAGGFSAIARDRDAIGTVEISRVLIDGKPYRINNIPCKGKKTFPFGEKFEVIKVKGDSMNQAGPEGIKNGDFVLVREQSSASNGDIVAAEIDNEDTCATLKYYHERGPLVILRPKSSNPIHKEHEFKKPVKGLSIRGVVVAVFKPV